MWKWIIMVVAVIGAVFAIYTSTRGMQAAPVPAPINEPIKNPYPNAISGAGIVEAESENVVIGVTEPGRVMEVYVKEGQKVEIGTKLFRIDSRELESQLKTAEAAVGTARADLNRTQAYRRKEDEPLLRAQVAEAESAQAEVRGSSLEAETQIRVATVALKDHQAHMRRLDELVKAQAAAVDDLERAQFAVQSDEAKIENTRAVLETSRSREKTAAAKIDEAKANLNTYLAGPWPPDVERARAALAEAEAQVARINSDIARRTLTSPIAGIVLRRKLREGEYAVAANPKAQDAGIVIGNLDVLHVRVDIDEFDVPRFSKDLKAKAILKSGEGDPLALSFVRVEPFIIPKSALTNAQTELVDTRVLQVIYKIEKAPSYIYVGQQMDVFIELPEKK